MSGIHRPSGDCSNPAGSGAAPGAAPDGSLVDKGRDEEEIRRLLRSRLFQFPLVGELNTAFGFSVFALGILIGIPYSLAALVSTVLGALSNFQRYGTLVFGSHDNRLILRFFAAYGLCYAVGLAPLSGARAHSLPILSVAAVCALPMAPLEFALQRLFVFRAARSPLELSLRR